MKSKCTQFAMKIPVWEPEITPNSTKCVSNRVGIANPVDLQSSTYLLLLLSDPLKIKPDYSIFSISLVHTERISLVQNMMSDHLTRQFSFA